MLYQYDACYNFFHVIVTSGGLNLLRIICKPVLVFSFFHAGYGDDT